ncbi:MAG: ParB/RepB/Spo0J family partition protein [Opitutales bacterium]
MANSKSRLGRGLSGLIASGTPQPEKSSATPPPAKENEEEKRPIIGERSQETAASTETTPAVTGKVDLPGYREIRIDEVDPNPYQPRREFDEGPLQELAASIRSEGLLQPVVVRRVGERYQLIAGERRWRACQALNMTAFPARVLEASDASSASLSLIENLQREGLNPVEEAMGYASLIRDFDLTQESVAERVGKGRATVANALRLLQLDTEIQGYLSRGLLSTGHAKVILGVETREERLILARKIIEEGLSVRAIEKIVQDGSHRRSGKPSGGRKPPPDEVSAIRDIEKKVSTNLNTRVTLKHAPKKGKLIIEYYGNDDLERILQKIGVQ